MNIAAVKSGLQRLGLQSAFAIALTICLIACHSPISVLAAEPIRVDVDARKVVGENVPFWANVVFHPTEYLDREWGEDLVRLLAKTGAVQRYVRLYNQPEDAAVVAADGSVSYKWDHFDRRVDLLLRHDIRPVVAFFSMPAAIAADPAQNRKRSFLNSKPIYIGPPKDYQQWQAMCADFARHALDRYGEKEVLRWYFTCWNEPNLSGFWHKADVKEYHKLYDHFAAAVKGVNAQIRIGGPSFASGATQQNPASWKAFLEHVATGTNHATGKQGTPIDYISVHTYGGHGGRGGPLAPYPSVDYLLAQQRTLVKIRDEFPQLREVPLMVAEWGETSSGATTVAKQPMCEVRNTQFAAAFLTTMVAKHLTWRQTEDPRIGDMFLCISGYENEQQFDFEGKRTVHTLHGFHKPVLNGYKLLAKLGKQLVDARVGVEKSPVSVIAARDGDKRLTVLVSHFNGEQWQNKGPAAEVELRVSTPWTEEREATVTHWRIDETHSNTCTVFRAMGSPKEPTPEQIEQIRARMDLETVEPAKRMRVGPALTMPISLPCNGVSLIEISR